MAKQEEHITLYLGHDFKQNLGKRLLVIGCAVLVKI